MRGFSNGKIELAMKYTQCCSLWYFSLATQIPTDLYSANLSKIRQVLTIQLFIPQVAHSRFRFSPSDFNPRVLIQQQF